MSPSQQGVVHALPIETILTAGTNDLLLLHDILQGSTISAVHISDPERLIVQGQDCDGLTLWKLTVTGSARFTFTNPTAPAPWLVEANFDSGGIIRRSEQAMMLAMGGAVIDSINTENGVTLTSHDGRTIEMPYALNTDGILITIMGQPTARL